MIFKLLKNKEKLKINAVKSNTNDNERTREKFILKEWVESSRKLTCTKNGTRGFLFGSQTPSKMDFSLGRSMVEMLGVLAIIGVLSIGGISGYTIAMRRYRANEISQVIDKYALFIYTHALNLMLNDPENYYINREGFWRISSDDIIPFSNSGLGGLPNGLKSIDYNTIHTTDSGDAIWFNVVFSDKELCKTTLNIVGIQFPKNPDDDAGFCNQVSGGYRGIVYFIMN